MKKSFMSLGPGLFGFVHDVDPDQWKLTDLDLHCLSFNI